MLDGNYVNLVVSDVVVIHLGVNDTDPRDWPNYRDFFIANFKSYDFNL